MKTAEPRTSPSEGRSPQSIEKDEAVAMARRALALHSCRCEAGDVKMLARQYLREVGLAE